MLLGMQISATTMEISMEVPQKTTYDPAILLLDICLKECKSTHKRDTYTPMFTAMLFITAKL
jgi:hypothetical protein